MTDILCKWLNDELGISHKVGKEKHQVIAVFFSVIDVFLLVLLFLLPNTGPGSHSGAVLAQ